MNEDAIHDTNVPSITEDSVIEVSNAIFNILKLTAEKHNFRSFPHRASIMSAIIEGIKDISSYIEVYPIDVVTKRDTVKLFAFASPYLIKTISSMPNFDFPSEYVYRALFSLLATVYNEQNLDSFANLDETCYILSKLALDENKKIATYAYFKGIQETCENLVKRKNM